MGVGMVLIIDPAHRVAVEAHLRSMNERFYVIGEVREGSGVVRWSR